MKTREEINTFKEQLAKQSSLIAKSEDDASQLRALNMQLISDRKQLTALKSGEPISSEDDSILLPIKIHC
ncbi:MAG: hypothetical protein ACOVQX_03330 [Legionella sp.]